MFYYEEMTTLGRWSPRVSPDAPSTRSAGGNRLKIRNVMRVPPEMQAFALDDLRELLVLKETVG